MKKSQLKQIIREEISQMVQEKRLTTAKNALENTVNQIMDPLKMKAVEDANNALLSAMKQLDNQLKGKTISVPGEWQGTIVGVTPVLKAHREEGQKKNAAIFKKAEPGLKVKVTSVQKPGDFDAKVGKIVDMDYYSWLNYDVELI
jgi:hypothetical protein